MKHEPLFGAACVETYLLAGIAHAIRRSQQCGSASGEGPEGHRLTLFKLQSVANKPGQVVCRRWIEIRENHDYVLRFGKDPQPPVHTWRPATMANAANALLRDFIFESEGVFYSTHPGGHFSRRDKLCVLGIEQLVSFEGVSKPENVTNRRLTSTRRRAAIGQRASRGS